MITLECIGGPYCGEVFELDGYSLGLNIVMPERMSCFGPDDPDPIVARPRIGLYRRMGRYRGPDLISEYLLWDGDAT